MIWLYVAAYLVFGLGMTMAIGTEKRKFPKVLTTLTWPVYAGLLVIGVVMVIYERWYANR